MQVGLCPPKANLSNQPFHIDPDISKASTPPSWVYTDVAFYERVRQTVFARSWQLIGDANAAKVPGQVHPFTMLEGCLDEPLLLVRDRNDRLQCMSNVCTHRGMLVCEEGGVENHLRCRYHGRRFGLDGKFVSMPEFERTANFPSKKDDLAHVPLAQWGPFLFAALDPAYSFDDWIGPMRERIGWLPVNECKFDASRSRDYLVACNWALYCENYLEGFHIPYVHAGLTEALDYDAYRTELHRMSNLQIGVGRGGDSVLTPPSGSPDHGKPIAGYYFWLFPNLMFNVYPWGISINVVRPLGVERTRVSFQAYVWDTSKLEAGAGASLDRVEREDEAIVEAVQKGLHSRLYAQGRYSPTREQGTHHFHRLLAEATNSKC